ncbi:MAG: 3-dehydroquinate synthase [Bacteroidales bacterium]|nr:3-dehydroquinate synthase [Bacteroidales bacterium]
MKSSTIIFADDVSVELERIIAETGVGKVFLLTEENTEALCVPTLSKRIRALPRMVIGCGERHKSIATAEQVWMFLSKAGADRKSLLINIGGGMLTDLGGFAASTFKRGMGFVNVPTTLLAQVDASVGGKTGVNFNGLKNEIGIFNDPVFIIITAGFLRTLDRRNFMSGYAEMLKHGLIKSRDHWEELSHFDMDNPDFAKLQNIVAHSVAVKNWFVENDPTEKNIRKSLNFGHTVGHAFESFAFERQPIPHGYAVAYGMMAELYLSVQCAGFPADDADNITEWLIQHYGKFNIQPSDYEPLYELMLHDKKNDNNRINFTLLASIGKAVINKNCPKELIFEAFNRLSDSMS